jgi:hypothetical protein
MRPAGAERLQCQLSPSITQIALRMVQLHLQPVVRQEPTDGVRPLDEGDHIGGEDVLPEVVEVPQSVEAVDVDVHHRDRAGSSLTSTKVGEVTGSATPSPAAAPWTKQVFPAPRSPESATTSPAPSTDAIAAAASRVSSGEAVVKVMLVDTPGLSSGPWLRPRRRGVQTPTRGPVAERRACCCSRDRSSERAWAPLLIRPSNTASGDRQVAPECDGRPARRARPRADGRSGSG